MDGLSQTNSQIETYLNDVSRGAVTRAVRRRYAARV
ncbi:MAG: hypothetical protein JWQ02_3830 [Capsulimonas sp.]|jgi:hypothetical protein|nr:hypothetical protein [Capsulimonas sp.]